MECWARSLGGCVQKISREHLVTESFWAEEKINVVGFPWCKLEPKKVGPAAIVAKILCRTHNSNLSPVDDGGHAAFHALQEAEQLIERRRTRPAQEWMRVCFSVNGPLLERWFIKTTINLLSVSGNEVRWALADGGTEVPERLVRIAFGHEVPAKPIGLYLVADVGNQIEAIDGLVFMPIFDFRDYLAAALFDFRGYRFMLNLIESPLPPKLPEVPGAAAPWGLATPFYHLNRINGDVNGYRSHFVDFVWPDSTFDHFAA